MLMLCNDLEKIDVTHGRMLKPAAISASTSRCVEDRVLFLQLVVKKIFTFAIVSPRFVLCVRVCVVFFLFVLFVLNISFNSIFSIKGFLFTL